MPACGGAKLATRAMTNSDRLASIGNFGQLTLIDWCRRLKIEKPL